MRGDLYKFVSQKVRSEITDLADQLSATMVGDAPKNVQNATEGVQKNDRSSRWKARMSPKPDPMFGFAFCSWVPMFSFLVSGMFGRRLAMLSVC